MADPMRKSSKSTRRSYLKTAGTVGTIGFTGIAGCLDSDTAGASDNENTITLGGTVPLTGSSASTGTNTKFGYDAAVQKINEMGGVTIDGTDYQLELDLSDDASDPDTATSEYQKLMSNDIDYYLGSFGSSIVLPTATICARNDKPMVQAGGGSDEIFTQGWNNIFGIFPRASRQMESTMEFFSTLDPEPQTYSIIYENDPFSKWQADGATAGIKDAGYEIAGSHQIPAEASDVSDVLSQVNDEEPDLLLTSTHAGVSQLVVKQMEAQNLDVDLLYQTLGPSQPSFTESLGESANYVTTASYWSGKASYKGEIFDSASSFKEYVYQNFDDVPEPFDYHIASGAACIVTYYHALKEAGENDPAAVTSALQNLNLEETFYGPIEFTADGDGDALKLGPAVAQVQEQNIEIVFPESGKTADVQYPMASWSDR